MLKKSFKKTNRLLTANDFSQIFNSGKNNKLKASDKYFLILAKINKQPEARLGFALAKSKIKQAVSRNRIKRVVREQFRLFHKTSSNLDVVIMANTTCISASNKDLAKSYKLLWKKLLKQRKKLLSSL